MLALLGHIYPQPIFVFLFFLLFCFSAGDGMSSADALPRNHTYRSLIPRCPSRRKLGSAFPGFHRARKELVLKTLPAPSLGSPTFWVPAG